MKNGMGAAALCMSAGAIALSLSAVRVATQTPPAGGSPVTRAVAYLATEVPRWRREHPCYSCHNNGDAARALIAAERRGYPLNGAMQDTLSWLARPERWDKNAQGGGFDDKTLARIQFAAALTSAIDAGTIPATALRAAANIVATDQQEDGSWRLAASQNAGSPATYGTALATWSARRTLAAAGDARFAAAIARADRWLRTADPQNMLDAAAILLGLAEGTDADGRAQRTHALALIAGGQGPDGGWGLYATSASEPFDTAVVLLALTAVPPTARPDARAYSVRITRGREFLIGKQLPDGSWPETTRPAGQESYAQRISTAGWATLALLATDGDRR